MYKVKLGYVKLTKKTKLNIKMAGEQMRFQQLLKTVPWYSVHVVTCYCGSGAGH